MTDDLRLLNEFVAIVKTECIAKHNGQTTFFTFDALPDCLVKKKYTRENYEKIKKYILKVKTLYLQSKHNERRAKLEQENAEKNATYGLDDDVSHHRSQNNAEKDKEVHNDVITDEDYVHFNFLDQVVAGKEQKDREMVS